MSADTQLKAFIDRVLRLKEEQDTIGQDIRDIYGEAKAAGYDKTVMGKLVAYLRKVGKAGASEVEEQEMIFDTYLDAYRRASGFSAIKAAPSRAHAHEEEFDPITGEFLTDHQASDDAPIVPPSPAESEAEEISASSYSRPATLAVPGGEPSIPSSDAGGEKMEGRPAARPGRPDEQSAHTDAKSGQATKSNSPETADETPLADIRAEGREVGTAISLRDPVANVEEGATGAIAAASNDPASRTDEDGERQHSSTVGFADDCRTGGKEQVAAASAPVGDAAADAHGIPDTNSTAADQPHAGGDHVTDDIPTAATAGALVRSAPAKSPLRPHCLNPGEQCGGYGTKHCRSCTAAMQEREVA